MNKKLMSLVLVGMLGFGMFGCASEEVTVEEKETKVVEEDKMKKNQDLDVVMIDNEYCKMTLKGKYQDEIYGEVGYKVVIENKTDRDIYVLAEDLSVDGVMNTDYTFYSDVSAKMKSETTIAWYDWQDKILTMEDLKNTQMTIVVGEQETYERFLESKIVID